MLYLIARASLKIILAALLFAVAFAPSSRAETANVTAHWSDLKITGKQTVRDLWRQKDLGVFENQFQAAVPSHGTVLVRVIPAK